MQEIRRGFCFLRLQGDKKKKDKRRGEEEKNGGDHVGSTRGKNREGLMCVGEERGEIK